MVADFAQHFENPVPDPVDCINPLSDPTPQIDSELSGLRRHQALILNEKIPLKAVINGLIVIHILKNKKKCC